MSSMKVAAAGQPHDVLPHPPCRLPVDSRIHILIVFHSDVAAGKAFCAAL
jgi:hypothetical protein